MVAVPAVGVTSPRSMRSVVVFPAPLGPRKPVTLPWSTPKDRSSTATTCPKRLPSPCTAMTDIVILPPPGRLVPEADRDDHDTHRPEVRAELDRGRYPLGVKVRDDELAAVPLVRHEFHGEWNYSLHPAAAQPLPTAR